jgi:hypothetical protein
MTLEATLNDVVERTADGVLVGRLRAPTNLAANAKGSIHDDATAQRLGFRGGTVAGSVHMQQFPPILVRAFGPRWFETGSLSCYFRNATTHGEPVRPYVRVPRGAADEQVEVWAERDTGVRVLDGTASVGNPAEPSLLRQRLANPAPARGELRILAHLQPGLELPAVPTRVTAADAERSLAVITEPLEWYRGASPWGGPVLHPGSVIRVMRPVERGMDIRRNKAVGLFGALETRHLRGPVFLDHDYEVSGRLLQLGETPKSEFLWYESTLAEPRGGPAVASMIMMLRFMKASSPLWP